ncbi:MAG TPA: hypothetical protein VNO30_37535 [Kofleriaceae bacterium]|nr:hypothetical protein [Kofleriaceae bacterium]
MAKPNIQIFAAYVARGVPRASALELPEPEPTREARTLPAEHWQ